MVICIRRFLLRKFIVHAALFGLFLGACATAQENDFAFFVPDFSNEEDIPVRYVPAEDGARLAYRQIGDIYAEKALIIVPGSTMYGFYYIPFMKDLYDKDLYIRVIDLRGHGDSGGPRGDVPHEESLIDDLHVHIGSIKSLNPKVRVYISGHSMGAGICGKYLEKYGYDSVDGAVYIAPFFHYRQPGMKDAGYVDVDILKTIFGQDHTVTQVYHPAGNDPKLVRKYTKIMSKASMLRSYTTFRKNHTTHALYLIGKKDELFDWKTSPEIFKGRTGIRYVIINEATHLDILARSTKHIREWIHASSGS